MAPSLLPTARVMVLPFSTSSAKKRDQIVAIDLGARSTKAVHVQRRGDEFCLLNYVFLDAPSPDKPPSADTLTDHFKEVMRGLGCSRTRSVTISLGVNEVLFRQIEAPLMPPADLRQMLRFNSKNYLQQDLPDHVFDCSDLPAPSDSKSSPAAASAPKHRVLVGGARRQLIDDLQAAVKDAGLHAEMVVPGIVGPTNAFELAEPEVFAGEVIALVEIGFKNTSICILDGGDIKLNRVVGIGGDRVTSGLADVMSITYTEAENIKIGMPQEVQTNLELQLAPLGRELRASIDFYEHQHDRAVTQVFVSGGSARSALVVRTLQAELIVPCKVWSAAKGLRLSLPPEKMAEVDQVAPQLSVAVGAAVASF